MSDAMSESFVGAAVAPLSLLVVVESMMQSISPRDRQVTHKERRRLALCRPNGSETVD